ncbi:MAG: GNAT family N-acetyltransferase [Solirubrobacteraceae bacterium]
MRGWRQDDLNAYAAMSADPEAMRFLGGVVDREQAWRSMAMFTGHWLLKGFGLWAVQRKADGVLLGRIGLWEPEGWPGLELGWTLARPVWGHGYATEAARAAMEWAWAALAPPQLISLIDPANMASIRVAQRLGMRPSRSYVLHGDTVTIYAIDRPGSGVAGGARPSR